MTLGKNIPKIFDKKENQREILKRLKKVKKVLMMRKSNTS